MDELSFPQSRHVSRRSSRRTTIVVLAGASALVAFLIVRLHEPTAATPVATPDRPLASAPIGEATINSASPNAAGFGPGGSVALPARTGDVVRLAGGTTADTAVRAPAVPLAGIVPIVTAPLQAMHGTTFVLTVALPAGTAARSARFSVRYDTDSLELLNVIDASGTVLLTEPAGDGSVELEVDAAQVGAGAPGATFLVRATEPREIAFDVVAHAFDAAGQPVAIAPSSVPMVVVP